jgi:hypothetical protein
MGFEFCIVTRAPRMTFERTGRAQALVSAIVLTGAPYNLALEPAARPGVS